MIMPQQSVFEAPAWRLLYVATSREADVATMLEERSMTSYIPKERLFVGAGRRRRVHERPLVRSYVFAQITAHDRPVATHLPYVRGIIGSDAPGNVAQVCKFMAELQTAEQAGVFDQTLTTEIKLALRDQVRIRSGPFAGFSGVIVKLKPKRRAVVIASIFGRSSTVTMPMDDLELAC
jgi:transcription antitermination factor NusG